MRIRVATVAVAIAVMGAPLAGGGRPAAAAPLGAHDVPDRVLVRVRSGVRPGDVADDVGGHVVSAESEHDGGARIVLRVTAGRSAAGAAVLRGAPGVVWAEPDRYVRATGVEPNDPCYSGAATCTQTPPPEPVDQNDFRIMHAPDAWSLTHGDASVRVAVLDTKIDTTHVDLQGKVDVGPEFLSPRPSQPCSSSEADHGTHVTGTIAAATNNNMGVAGLGWNTRVLGIRVLDDCGVGLTSDIADGVRAAVNAGVRIINMSFSGDASQEMADAIASAEQHGVLVVAAAGNTSGFDPNPPVGYPAGFPGVVGVAATRKTDDRIDTSYSYRGTWVAVAAPGTDIWSTAPNNSIEAETGTSMAAPHVSAVAALILAVAPDMTGAELAAVLEQTATHIEGTGTLVRYGRVDAAAAVAEVVRRPSPGYRLAASDGGIFAFGGSQFFGSTGDIQLNQPIVSAAATSTGSGYWMAARDGGIFAFGDAAFFGSTGSIALNQPIVAMAATPTADGYWMAASDGGIFAFGDAGFFGSTGNIRLNKPVVGMAPTPDGLGYWLVGSDGGIFTFGTADFFGSTGMIPLNKPIVGMAATRSGRGYWLVASDGGIFAFGDAQFYGSTGGITLNKPIVAIRRTPSGQGYWLVASDGGIFAFGDAEFYGSTGDIPLNKPIVAVA